MKIDREKFLTQLELVLPGLSPLEIIEQSSCFIFKNGKVMTYNDEIICIQDSLLHIEAAVPALPLISILRKLRERMIEVTPEFEDKGELLIKGKSKRIGIRVEEKIRLPIQTVKKPKKWKPLSKNFADAVSMVQECAGRDESQFAMTCIHLDSKWIEACDNYQAARYEIKMKIEKPILIRKQSLRHIVSLNMIEFGETKSWIHFRNRDGLVLGCRRFTGKYPDLSSILKIAKGIDIILPKGIEKIIERAEIFSIENADDNRIKVNLRENKFKITGRGVSGWFSEIKRIKYDDKPSTFTIAPNLLSELVQRHNKCILTKNRLKVKAGKFVYVTALGAIKEE